ncbi:hypothetical protein MBCUT_20110 [Methanobrevibacter cuticularis]|uniref:DUF2299 domain-containing protein n=1 Tax=Methanobrevibacter cuticularis TaxID=47311 RepID=A0A166CL16_9EURY|nr:DUF2299 family protein [Methanobrevibacter cuticularis]KZX14621.1 hypothetical protein MBCUT_20110 [Methanobrevibacter cuticularis]
MIDEKQIRDWLVEEGFYKDVIHDENANFHFIINYPEDHVIDLIQPKNKKDVLLVGCATEISPEELGIIKDASIKKKEKFIWDIRFSLNQFLLDFELEHPDNNLQRFIITEEIYEDGLSKNNLIFALKKVFKGKLQCIWLIERDFGRVNGASYADDNSMFI